MSKNTCCNDPAFCHRTNLCSVRESYRQAARNTDPSPFYEEPSVSPAAEDALFEKAFAAATSAIKPSNQSSINSATHSDEMVGYEMVGYEPVDVSGGLSMPPNPNATWTGSILMSQTESISAYRQRMGMTETDPNGLSTHTPGAKSDAGKVRVGLVMAGFSRALMEVAKVGTSGANKYTPNGWQEVPNGIERYTDARDRHQLKEYMGEEYDTDSFKDAQYLHAAHEAWNSLARLELILRARQNVNG